MELKELVGEIKKLAENEETAKEVVSTLKKELGDKINEPLTLEKVKDFVDKNDAGKEFITNLKTTVSSEALTTYKTSEDYKKELDTLINAKKKELEIEFEKKYNKEMTPDQKRLAELEAKQIETEKKLQRKELELEVNSFLQESKLPKDLLKVVKAPDLNTAKSNITALQKLIDDKVKAQVEAEFKKIGADPKKDKKPKDKKVTADMLTALANAAKKSGRVEDRVKYAEAKYLYEQQNKE